LKEILVNLTGGDFIDPSDCGSFVRYRMCVTKYHRGEEHENNLSYNFEMTLGDCNRVITWGFDADDPNDWRGTTEKNPIEKMDKAIEIMLTARASLIQASAIYRLENGKIKAAEKAADALKEKDKETK
jgi:hypothetical protein